MDGKRFILDQTTIKKLLTIFKLHIPDYQRNFVWRKEKKQKLLDSLFRGFPIGSITLYEDNYQSYYVIDGLQRINTLNQYLSRPNEIIPSHEFFRKITPDIESFLAENKLPIKLSKLKKCLITWYKSLDKLYDYEKVSILYQVLKAEGGEIGNAFDDLLLVEKLTKLLESKIAIANDDIALIIYRGDKNDLPDLFKNINTGSVALSPYEILQAVWNGYLLDKDVLGETVHAYDMALTLINQEYEMSAKRETGSFDAFKNLMGLNHIICCKESCHILFKANTLKKLPVPIPLLDGTKKYYESDGIAFEIYSTLLCSTPNRIANAIEDLFKRYSQQEISRFAAKLNRIICEAIDTAVNEISQKGMELQESKYHSLYILAGIIFSQYDITLGQSLSVTETKIDESVRQMCLDWKMHKENKWFVDKNRQIDFFNIKIKELQDEKRSRSVQSEVNHRTATEGPLAIELCNEAICAYTVKEFYRKIFLCLIEHGVNFDSFVPYATGSKRFLINTENCHIDGSPFVSPIQIRQYFLETHKSRKTAKRDISNFLAAVGVTAAIY